MCNTKNPFKIGDKVVIPYDNYGILSRCGFKLNTPYTIVEMDKEAGRLYFKEGVGCLHHSHLRLHESKEEKDMTQQTQQKTKRVPFTHELWEKWKDKGGKVIYVYGPHTIKDMVCFSNATTTYRYAGYCEERDCVYVCEGDDFSLEIPVTTKRIPFNSGLKDAKVFYGDTELIEWVQMNSGVVCGSYDTNGFAGVTTNLYHPNDLHMEIEEDA